MVSNLRSYIVLRKNRQKDQPTPFLGKNGIKPYTKNYDKFKKNKEDR
jgi:hypothetical protein